MSQPLEILNVFNDLILKPNFLKNKKMKHHFLVENPKTENSTFSYKTSSSEANVKKKRMWSIQWTYHKEQNFGSN